MRTFVDLRGVHLHIGLPKWGGVVRRIVPHIWDMEGA